LIFSFIISHQITKEYVHYQTITILPFLSNYKNSLFLPPFKRKEL